MAKQLAEKLADKTLVVSIIGLGYVGLPLAVEFGKQFKTIGFDINEARINELIAGKDSTLEVEPEELSAAAKLSFTSSLDAGGYLYRHRAHPD